MMKICKIVLLFIVFFGFANAQDKEKRFELGPTLFTVNSLSKTYYSIIDRPFIEYSNGLFFRYNKKRISFRAVISYNESYFKYYAPPGCFDCTSGESGNKDFRAGVGFQYSLLKKKNVLYAFSDLAYRNVFSSGFVYGGIAGLNNSFSSSTNGIDGLLGMGLKLKLFEDIFLLPELGYNIFYGDVNYSTSHLIYGNPKRFHYIEGNMKPVAKLHLTVRF
ncbi:MAG: hypothetical protein H0U95_08195 [Bacteroidetes bacterium]|nr:hypothetical protein [Bacteroidota bacterium]